MALPTSTCSGGHDEFVFLRAFDLIELNGDDLRREPLICRKSTLAVVLARGADGIELNDHMEHDDAALV
jgi:ATP-dependent DNA ligase